MGLLKTRQFTYLKNVGEIKSNKFGPKVWAVDRVVLYVSANRTIKPPPTHTHMLISYAWHHESSSDNHCIH